MSTKRQGGLGKGLSALLENANTDITSKYDNNPSNKVVGAIAEIPVNQIEANPFQPRSTFEKEALEELALSIKEHGIIQPVTVRKLGYDKYQLISGERRFKASQVAGLTSIPVYIRVANDQAMLEMALIENIQREELNPIEIGLSYKRLIDECKLTQEQLSDRVSKQRSSIANYMRLLKLPGDIQAALRDRKLSFGHARAIVNIDNKDVLLNIYRRILAEGLSVRQVEDLVRNQNGYRKELEKNKTVKAPKPLSISDKKVLEDLSGVFNTNVQFSRSKNGKGKIVIPFGDDDELRNILGVLDL